MSFISYLKDGISLGSIYAIIALGYTMVYGIAKMLNFAHGDVIMVGAFVILTAVTKASMSPILAIILSVVICTVAGVVIEAVAYRPLRKASSNLAVLITAIGVSYLLQNLATYITGGLPQMYPSLPGLSSQITIAGTSTKMVTVITPFLVVALVVVLTQLINHTKIGMAMRAASRDFETAQLMGIKINNIISFTFVIGSFLAALGFWLYRLTRVRACIKSEAWLTGCSSHGRTAYRMEARMQPQLNQNVTSSTTCVSRETLLGFPMPKIMAVP